MLSFVAHLLLTGGIFQVVASAAPSLRTRDGSSPSLPYDANTSKYCSWWVDLTSEISCPSFLNDNFINLEEFRRWNPSITADCGNLVVGKSYCVETINEPAPVPTLSPSYTVSTASTPSTASPASTASTVLPSTTSPTSKPVVTTTSSSKPPSSTSTTIATTTKPGNGIATPQPTQPGMVANCNKFHWIDKGVVCSQILSYHKLSLADFVKWNPSVGSDCTNMWAEVNVCVGVIGGTTPTTTTSAGNGIQTPQPTQPGMVANCNKFHWIAKGVVCSQVISYHGITRADFVKWNPSVGSDCAGMQAEVYVCVSVIGGTTPTTTVSAGNGIQTPQPTQPGMVTNCKKFHYVDEGVVCSQITSYNKISLADFVKWNPGVGADCRTMWAKTYVCVGV